MVTITREFDKEPGETINTFKWSHDGQYLAKSFRKESKSGKIKEGITVFELPSMDTLKDNNGK